MGNFNRDNGKSGGGGFNRGFGGGRPFGGGKKFGGGGGRDGGRPSMHQATCSECNASCEVPFRPTGSRPVFCTNCFGKQGGGRDSGRPPRFEGERHERPRFEDKKVDNGNSASSSGQVVEQIKILNGKIDKLIELLTPKKKVETIEKSEVEEVVAKVAPKKSSAKKKK